jgi:hypothetical protein
LLIRWHFIGRASTFEGRAAPIVLESFRVGAGGPFALPVKGDLIMLPISGGDERQFRVAGRRYDFTGLDSPVLHVDLELVQ